MERTNGKSNGAGSNGAGKRGPEPTIEEAPQAVRDLAEACVRFVERSLGVRLDYEPETLSLVDHYVEEGRKAGRERPETLPLLAQTVGAYLGEVVRRRHKSWWRTEEEGNPNAWRLELEAVYMVLRPIELVTRSLRRPAPPPLPPEIPAREEDEDDEEAGAGAGAEEREAREAQAREAQMPDPEEDVGPAFFELDEDDRAAVAERLAQLPPVSDEEFYAPSTHIEVVDIVVDTIRARRIAAGMEPDAHLEPEDYED
ncbi:hypothetical protein [Polyangium aurulentum]|uniref:hypothetical protein n=1 Tax=Polyangium aurulentum TaxID=2567896 RepID=UPI001F3B8B81|nr:hypothetical protein [Polyangium aurulentum]